VEPSGKSKDANSTEVKALKAMSNIPPNQPEVKKNLPGFSRLTDSEIAAAFGRLPDDALQPLELDDLDVDLPDDSPAITPPDSRPLPPPATVAVNLSAKPNTSEVTIITDLARLPASTLLNVRAVAQIYGVTVKTISRQVAGGTFPPPIVRGHQRYWLAGRLVLWDRAQAQAAEDEAEKRLATIERDRRKAARYEVGGLP